MKNILKINRRSLLILLLVVLLLAALAAGGVYAKYRSQSLLKASVHYDAQLAERFVLMSNQLVQQPDGSYASNGQETEAAQSFALIPGSHIPYAPYLCVTNKSALSAVLYVEIKPIPGVSFTPGADWTRLAGVKGLLEGDLYVYHGGEALAESSAPELKTEILLDGLQVADSAPDAGSMVMAGYLLQSGREYQPEQAAALFQQRVSAEQP